MLHRVALFLLLLTTISARADLEGVSLNGQDYVTLESLATTCGMGAPSSRAAVASLPPPATVTRSS